LGLDLYVAWDEAGIDGRFKITSLKETTLEIKLKFTNIPEQHLVYLPLSFSKMELFLLSQDESAWIFVAAAILANRYMHKQFNSNKWEH